MVQGNKPAKRNIRLGCRGCDKTYSSYRGRLRHEIKKHNLQLKKYTCSKEDCLHVTRAAARQCEYATGKQTNDRKGYILMRERSESLSSTSEHWEAY